MKTEFFKGVIQEPQFPDREINADNFESIQKAVDACASAGGGTVIVGEGQWETGSIRMYSNICLYFKRGAIVNFSKNPSDYLPVVFTRWEGTECYNYSPLIYAHHCENIAVCGEGKLYGNGEAWWRWKKLQEVGSNDLYDAAAAGVPVEQRIFGTEEAALRPSFIQLVNCRQVLIEGITLNEDPQWTIHPVYCQDVVIRNVHIYTTGPNTDGLMLKGLPEQKLEDIILQDIELTAQEAMTCSDVNGLVMERVVLKKL